jgi:hypothetical protein
VWGAINLSRAEHTAATAAAAAPGGRLSGGGGLGQSPAFSGKAKKERLTTD